MPLRYRYHRNKTRKPIVFALAFWTSLGLAAYASAAHIPAPEPIPVPHKLLLYPDPIDGRHAYGPADGVDVLPGGKLDWTVPPEAQEMLSGYRPRNTTWWRDDPAWQWTPPAVPPIYGSTGGCDCVETTRTADPAPVPLPASVWLLLAGITRLALSPRTAPARRADRQVPRCS